MHAMYIRKMARKMAAEGSAIGPTAYVIDTSDLKTLELANSSIS